MILWIVFNFLNHTGYKVPEVPKKSDVVEQLEAESKMPRNGTMRMPKEKVKWIEYLLEKYGEDYEVSLLLVHTRFGLSVKFFVSF